MGSLKEHNQLVKKIILELSQSRLAVVWSHDTGMALRMETLQPFRYGLEGSPDIVGFLKNGKFCGFEIKTGRARQASDQLNFQKACDKFGAHYAVVRSSGEAVQRVKEWLGESDARNNSGNEP